MLCHFHFHANAYYKNRSELHVQSQSMFIHRRYHLLNKVIRILIKSHSYWDWWTKSHNSDWWTKSHNSRTNIQLSSSNSETDKWDDTARIKSKVRKKTYRVQMDNGRITYRNRKRIRQREESGSQASNKSECEDPIVKGRTREETGFKPRRSERIKQKAKRQ